MRVTERKLSWEIPQYEESSMRMSSLSGSSGGTAAAGITCTLRWERYALAPWDKLLYGGEKKFESRSALEEQDVVWPDRCGVQESISFKKFLET